MPKTVPPLTEARIRAAVPRDKSFKLSDGARLYLQVMPSGTRLWHMSFRRDGKASTLSFGAYPGVSLEMARAERDKVRRLLAEGKDPAAIRREAMLQARAARAAQSASRSFRLAMNEQGELTIDRPQNRMHLNVAQVAALRAFLAAAEHGENQGVCQGV